MKQALAAMIIAGLGVLTLVQAQQTPPAGKCSLTLAQSPEIRSLRLGMSSEEVLKLFPGSSDDATIRQSLSSAGEQFGMARVLILNGKYLPKPKFAGVVGFSFNFLDNRLSELWVGYDGPNWRTVDDFIAKLTEALSIPTTEVWEADAGGKRLTCQGFKMWVAAGERGASIRLKSLEADQIVRNREEAAKEKARKEFKP